LGITAGRIEKLGIDIRSFKEPLKRAIKNVVIPSIRKNFDSGGRPAWEPWSESTVEIMQKTGVKSSGLLIRSGALRRTMGYQKLWTITPTFAVLADLPQNIWYGKVHQGGYEGRSMKSLIAKHGGNRASAFEEMIGNISSGNTPRGAPGIPARPFVMLQPEDEDAITQIFIDWLGERVNRSWPGVI
jgi:phage gpG-like protein